MTRKWTAAAASSSSMLLLQGSPGAAEMKQTDPGEGWESQHWICTENGDVHHWHLSAEAPVHGSDDETATMRHCGDAHGERHSLPPQRNQGVAAAVAEQTHSSAANGGVAAEAAAVRTAGIGGAGRMTCSPAMTTYYPETNGSTCSCAYCVHH